MKYIVGIIMALLMLGCVNRRNANDAVRVEVAQRSAPAVVQADEGGVGPAYLEPNLDPNLQHQDAPRGAPREFSTDFSRAAIDFREVISGGPQKDGIPAIDDPTFVSLSEADDWIGDNEAVLVVSVTTESGRETHIFPIQILMWHEIINDTVGDTPVTVTYCPLCNSGAAFLRNFDGQVLDFGVSGRLRYSNMIMYDRQTETWWQQANGQGVVGRYTGGTLRLLPMLTLSWKDARSRYPEAVVLSRDTGYPRTYGRNPYTGYDTASRPFLYSGPPAGDEFPALSRVVALFHNGGSDAYPYEILREQGVINDTVGGDPIAVIWRPGVASPLDSGRVDGGRDIGTANVFLARLDDRQLTFALGDGQITDRETGSQWDASGVAIAGPLKDRRLEALPTIQHFWFSWTAFTPEEQ